MMIVLGFFYFIPSDSNIDLHNRLFHTFFNPQFIYGNLAEVTFMRKDKTFHSNKTSSGELNG